MKARFTENMFEIEYRQYEMKMHMKSKRDRCVEKSMVTVLWNPYRFHIVTILPSRASFDASWFIHGSLVSLVEKFFPAGWSAERRKLVVHIDTAPIHNSTMTQNFSGRHPLKWLLHSSYFLCISPSDFYLFGKAKSALIGQEIPDEIDVFRPSRNGLH
jgi:hypothetical protein